MKFLDRLINFIFSLAMLVISLVILLVIFQFIDRGYVNGLINDYVWNPDYKMIVAITAGVVFLAGLKTTIFLSDFKKKRKQPIMVSSDNGNVQIAYETIESTAKAVAKSHEEVKEVNARMVNRNKGVDIYMSIMVAQDTNIRSLTRAIQDEVKESVHDTTGVLVLNTDIKVKNIVEKNKKATNHVRAEVETAPVEPTPVEPAPVAVEHQESFPMEELENVTEEVNEIVVDESNEQVKEVTSEGNEA